MTTRESIKMALSILRASRRSGTASSMVGALVLFVLVFLGVGFVGLYWLFPYLGISATSFEALVFWAVLLFLALLAFAKYKPMAQHVL